MRRLVFLLTLACLLAVTGGASASSLITRNPQGPVKLAVNQRGVAMLTLRTNGQTQHIFAWGAVNMSRGRLLLDYSGGTGASGAYWQTFQNTCGPYRGGAFPGSTLIVASCTARDGSHWAVQEWKRSVPNFGGITGSTDVRLSHWRGAVADLTVFSDWSRYGPSKTEKFPHLFGTYSWHGTPIAVGEATPEGVPLDDQGRNIYLDALNSNYGFPAGGSQWSRVNGFLANRPYGQFCFEIGPKRSAPTLLGQQVSGASTVNRYRITSPGPGVTPDIRVMFDGPPSPYDPNWQLTMNDLQRQLVPDPYVNCGHPGAPTF